MNYEKELNIIIKDYKGNSNPNHFDIKKAAPGIIYNIYARHTHLLHRKSLCALLIDMIYQN